MESSIELIRNHILMKGVPEHELEAAVSAMDYMLLSDHEKLITEGEIGDCCYFIVGGKALVSSSNLTARQIALDVLLPGAIVGEIALIMQDKRTADVTAIGQLEVLRLKSVDFYRLAKASPMFHESLLFSSRIRLLHGLLRKTTIWSTIPDAELRGLAEITRISKVKRGDTILTEGELSTQLYMISQGRFQIKRNDRKVGTLASGDCFGEIDLLLDGPYSGTITALEDSELLIIGKEEFHFILQQFEQVHRQFIELACIRHPELIKVLKPKLNSLPHTASSSIPNNKHQHMDRSSAENEQRDKQQDYKKSDHWISIVLSLGGLFILTTICAIWLRHPAWIGAALFIGGLAGPVSFVSFIRGTQLLGYRVSRLALVFIISAITAAPSAFILERLFIFGGWQGSVSKLGSIAEPITVSLIEESLKLLVCILWLRGRKQRFLMDAIVFGAAIGMGFAAVESILYGWTYLQQGTAADMLAVLWVRALLSPFGHGTWTAIAAAGLWYGLHNKNLERSKVNSLIMIGLMVISISLHALWDNEYTGRLLGMIIIGLVGLVLLYLLLKKGMRDEVHALKVMNPIIEEPSAKYAQYRSLSLQADDTASLLCDGCGTVTPASASYCARCGQALRVTR